MGARQGALGPRVRKVIVTSEGNTGWEGIGRVCACPRSVIWGHILPPKSKERTKQMVIDIFFSQNNESFFFLSEQTAVSLLGFSGCSLVMCVCDENGCLK